MFIESFAWKRGLELQYLLVHMNWNKFVHKWQAAKATSTRHNDKIKIYSCLNELKSVKENGVKDDASIEYYL